MSTGWTARFSGRRRRPPRMKVSTRARDPPDADRAVHRADRRQRRRHRSARRLHRHRRPLRVLRATTPENKGQAAGRAARRGRERLNTIRPSPRRGSPTPSPTSHRRPFTPLGDQGRDHTTGSQAAPSKHRPGPALARNEREPSRHSRRRSRRPRRLFEALLELERSAQLDRFAPLRKRSVQEGSNASRTSTQESDQSARATAPCSNTRPRSSQFPARRRPRCSYLPGFSRPPVNPRPE